MTIIDNNDRWQYVTIDDDDFMMILSYRRMIVATIVANFITQLMYSL